MKVNTRRHQTTTSEREKGNTKGTKKERKSEMNSMRRPPHSLHIPHDTETDREGGSVMPATNKLRKTEGEGKKNKPREYSKLRRRKAEIKLGV